MGGVSMGLVLGRYEDQQITLRDQVSETETTITFMKRDGNQYRVLIEAPRTIAIKRQEKCQSGAKVSESKKSAAKSPAKVTAEVS